MIIAVTSSGPELESQVDARFGRCAYFLIVDTDDLSFEAVSNPNTAQGGAGIQSAQLIAEKGAKAILTGNCGPNAHKTLSAAGVKVAVGCAGSVRDVIEQFKDGKLAIATEPNVSSHFGMNASST